MATLKQEQIASLLREVLGESYFVLQVRGHALEEDLVAGTSTVRMTLVDPQTGNERTLEGTGVGLVDAAFNALIRMLVSEYPSLTHIRFASFSLSGAVGTGERGSQTDAEGIARLEVVNQVGRTFLFTDSSRSVAASCIRVTLSAVEYFVNSERAFYRVRSFLDDAKAKGRPDLAERYTQMLTLLVQNSSYAGSPER
jgi:hypothetical protein